MSSTKIRINEREGAACRALSATRFHGPFANFLRKIFFKRLPQKASDVAPLSFPFKALKIFSLFPSHLHCIVGRFLILLLLLLSLSLSDCISVSLSLDFNSKVSANDISFSRIIGLWNLFSQRKSEESKKLSDSDSP
jgi:hypothetical protein